MVGTFQNQDLLQTVKPPDAINNQNNTFYMPVISRHTGGQM